MASVFQDRFMKKILNYTYSIIIGMSMAMVYASADTNTSNDFSKTPGVDITVQSLFGIVTGVACWATRFIMIVMVIVIVWYGFQMMASQGNDTKFTGAKKSLTNAVIGMVVILGAYTIIATVGNAVTSLGPDAPEKSAKYTMFIPLSCAGY